MMMAWMRGVRAGKRSNIEYCNNAPLNLGLEGHLELAIVDIQILSELRPKQSK